MNPTDIHIGLVAMVSSAARTADFVRDSALAHVSSKAAEILFMACDQSPSSARLHESWLPLEAHGGRVVCGIRKGPRLDGGIIGGRRAGLLHWFVEALGGTETLINTAQRNLDEAAVGVGSDSGLVTTGQIDAAIRIVGERTRLYLIFAGMESLLWHRRKTTAVRANTKPENGEPTGAVADLLPPEMWRRYHRLVDLLFRYDRQLQGRLDLVAPAAREPDLVAYRSIMSASRALPWWLDGTLELASCILANPNGRQSLRALVTKESAKGASDVETADSRTGVREGRATTATSGDSDRQKLMMAVFTGLRRQGPLVEEPFRRERSGKNQDLYYRWQTIDDEDENRYIELKARVGTGRESRDELTLHLCSESTALPSASRLIGRIMFMNGLTFCWVPRNDPGLACAQIRGVSLPKKGRLVLLDGQLNEVYEPVER